MQLNIDDIQLWLEDKLTTHFGIKLNFPDYTKTHFFSSKMQLFPRDLIYLCIELEKELGVKFSEDDFLSEDMFTIDGLRSIFMRKNPL
ncbi:hypothetical protein [Desulfovibrio sp.]|uniref:hypothetical protein n=1 Tax=Desulfovibrio sp. TaxID=885 RepID=UPI0025BDEE1A|nr:hypothetical protein [Desulfovibrio sp.]